MMRRVRRYPARSQAVVVALVALVTAFGVDWSPEQVAAITTLSATLFALLVETPRKHDAGQ